jgi:hypothetical protein
LAGGAGGGLTGITPLLPYPMWGGTSEGAPAAAALIIPNLTGKIITTETTFTAPKKT